MASIHSNHSAITTMTTKLFISYRSMDSAKVDTIVARLRSLKAPDGTPIYDIWQDKTGILAGQDWWNAIVQNIISCDFFVFMISHEAVKNLNCRAELSYARKRNRPIIPLVLEGEYTYNTTSGKNDISFWDDIPDDILNGRFQFLFYEGVSFVERLNDSINHLRNSGFRDMPAPQPPDPRNANDSENDTSVIYAHACDYAWRVDFTTAQKLFQRLIDWRDQMFGNDAHEWVILLREYEQIMRLHEQNNLRYKIPQMWQKYVEQFPKPFTALFDPRGFRELYSSTNLPMSSPINLPNEKDYPYKEFRDTFRDIVPPWKYPNVGNVLNLVFGELSKVRQAVPVLPINQDFDFEQRGPTSVLASFENVKISERPFYNLLEQIWPRSERPVQGGVGETKYIPVPSNSNDMPGVLFVVTTRYRTSTSNGLYVNTPLEGIDVAIDQILDCAQEHSLNSLALPLLGTGYANIKTVNNPSLKVKFSQLVLGLLIQKFEQRLRDPSSKLRRAIIVVYSKEPQSSDEHEIWNFTLKFIRANANTRDNQINKILQEFD